MAAPFFDNFKLKKKLYICMMVILKFYLKNIKS